MKSRVVQLTGRASRYNLLLILNPDQTSGDQPSFKPTLMVLLLFVCFLIFNFVLHAWVLAQLCLTLCDPMDCSLLWGCKESDTASVYGIFQVTILEWVAISYSRGSSWSRDRTLVSCISCIGRQMVYQLRHLGCHSVLGYSQLINNIMIVSGEQRRFCSQINGWMELLNVLGITAK